MNTHLEFQSKKQSKYPYLVILLIAIGLHLFVFSPLIAPHLIIPIFENTRAKEPQKSPLSIRLIYKKEALITQQKSTQNPVFENEPSRTFNLKSSGIPYKQGFDQKAPFSKRPITDYLFDINPQKSHFLSNLELKEERINLNLETSVRPDKESILEPLDISEGASLLSQSLENTQIDSFSEGLDNPATNKSVLSHIFSSKTKKQLTQAEDAQTQYEEAQTEEVNYAITEDSDGTRYVNIKGICWRIPPPGTEEAWTIVYAGCSGQTKTFNIEINIGMDILGPDSPLTID